MEFEGDVILSVLRDVSQGILFLHKMEPSLVHGDLKSHNVLIDACFRSRVSDFGLPRAKQYGKNKAVGTPYWMAPELLKSESSNTASSDVYAFGIVLCEIYARKAPYEGEEPAAVFREICDPKINKRPPVPSTMPPLVASLMHDCLVATPEDRPAFDEIANRIKRFVIDDVHPVGLRRNDGRDFDLLLKVFPRHIADALRDGRRVEPEHHDCISCFFRCVQCAALPYFAPPQLCRTHFVSLLSHSDIVSFTTISGSITPSKVSDMLHRLFSKMDSLADELGVFKGIKSDIVIVSFPRRTCI
jgi:serine/threonine protein kinase